MLSGMSFQILGETKAKLWPNSLKGENIELSRTTCLGDHVWYCTSSWSATREVQNRSGSPYEEICRPAFGFEHTRLLNRQPMEFIKTRAVTGAEKRHRVLALRQPARIRVTARFSMYH